MATFEEGKILDILTGLGNGFEVKRGGEKPLLIGGGVNMAKIYKHKKNDFAILGLVFLFNTYFPLSSNI